jgi:hypothetical protein
LEKEYGKEFANEKSSIITGVCENYKGPTILEEQGEDSLNIDTHSDEILLK